MKRLVLLVLLTCGAPEKLEPAPKITTVLQEWPPPDLCIRRRECCWVIPVSPGLECAECCD
jgi:hypothetical protein